MDTEKILKIIDTVTENLVKSLPLYKKRIFGFKKEWEEMRHKELWENGYGTHNILDFLEYMKEETC